MFDPTKVNNDLNMLAPFFRLQLETALKEVHAAGYDLFVFEGWRSPARQSYLYEQGRTRDGKIVTNSKPWTSYHQFSLACDLVYKVNNRWSWSGDYDKPAEIMKRYGFEWGGDFKSFKDIPHFQITAGISTLEAKAIMDQQGLPALWILIEDRWNERKKSVLS